MRILLCHPGATWAVADVYEGYRKALKRAGVEVFDYSLAGRIATCGGFLSYAFRRSKLPKEQKPTPADVLYMASQGMLERALRLDVDWVVCVSGIWLHPEILSLLRRARMKVAVLLTESPYLDKEQMKLAELADVVFTTERTSVPGFRQVQPHTYYLAHAFDPEVHSPGVPADGVPAHDVVFVGTGFQERIDALTAVDWDGIDLGLYGSWTLMPSRSKLRKHLRAGITPNGMTIDLYRRAKIGLNLHRTSMGFGRQCPHIETAESVGPRVLELAASGTFFISDWRPELDEFCGGLVPTFRTPQEMEAMIRHYLDRPGERENIAGRLPDAVCSQTFDRRAEELIGRLEAAKEG